jgi:hypothetical protein
MIVPHRSDAAYRRTQGLRLAFSLLLIFAGGVTAAQESEPAQPCRPWSHLETVGKDSALGKLKIANNEKAWAQAASRWPDINWLRWVVLGSNDEVTHLLDEQTAACRPVAKSCECTVWIWSINTPGKQSFASAKQQVTLQCGSRRMRFDQVLLYQADGRVTESAGTANFEAAVPDSMGEWMLDMACNAVATEFRFYTVHVPSAKTP